MNAERKIVNGEFIRTVSSFRHWVTADGTAGPSGEGGFKAEANRYHLYVSYACPWAHRTLIFRALKGLEEIISVSVVHPLLESTGWTFDEYAGSTPDKVNNFTYLSEAYQAAHTHFDGVVTVPVLWDKQRKTIVNNESAEIIRMLNTAFNAFTDIKTDYYPIPLRSKIDQINDVIYHNVNNGVYRAGFATTQQAYEKAYDKVFNTLDALEKILSTQRYLVGDNMTEADWRLFTTLVRFDSVYYGHFKTNKKRLVDYPNLWAYTRDLYQTPGVQATMNMDHIKYHYYASHKTINPKGIVPKGPEIDFMSPHNRCK